MILEVVFLITTLLLPQEVFLVSCNRTAFPIIMGGSAAPAFCNMFDYNSVTDSIVCAGRVDDTPIRVNTSPATSNPWLALFSGVRKKLQWGKFIKLPVVASPGIIRGVAFNADGSLILAHSSR
jgi:hypothetical protein